MTMGEMHRQFLEARRNIEEARQLRRDQGLAENQVARHMLLDRDIVVLWGMYRVWSPVIIAHVLGLKKGRQVRLMIDRFVDEPSLIFEYPVLRRLGQAKSGKRNWMCGFCAAKLTTAEEETAREHVALHLLPEAIVKLHGVFQPEGSMSGTADVYVVKTSGTEWEPLKRATWTLTGSGDLPPMFVPLVMLVRQAQGRDLGASQCQALEACSPASCVA